MDVLASCNVALHNMSRVMRKPVVCICENIGADQRLCLRYIDSTFHLLPKSEISGL